MHAPGWQIFIVVPMIMMCSVTNNVAQEITTEAWNAPSWKQAALEYHHGRGNHALIVETPPEDLTRLRHLTSDNVSLERAWNQINRIARERYRQAPEAIYNALLYELRTCGVPQLKNLSCQRRLADLSAAQIKAAMASLQARRSQYPKVSDDLLKALARIYSEKVDA
jgi:hypothetical protein